jgi:hypothetical protein
MSAIKHYEPHSLALIFPAMDAEALENMAADIKQNGQRDPIVLHEGKILDGVQRQAACEKANVTPSYSHWENLPEWKRKGGPLAFVISENLHRRHMTTGQRAEIAEGLAKGTHGGDRKSDQGLEIAFDQMSVNQAAKTMHVSPASVKQVRKVRREAPEKIKDIRSGKLAPSKAASDLPAEKRERKGKLLNGEDAAKAFDPEQFKALVLKPITKLFKKIAAERVKDAKRVIFDDWFAIHHREKKDWVSPTHVIYEDGTQIEVERVLDRERGKVRLRLQSDNAKKLEPVSSQDWTSLVRKKGAAK